MLTNVLVTGVWGNVGFRLAYNLLKSKKYRVFGVDNCYRRMEFFDDVDTFNNPDHTHRNMTYKSDMFEDAKNFRFVSSMDGNYSLQKNKIEYIFHNGAVLSVPLSIERPLKVTRNNNDVTTALLQECSTLPKGQLKGFVYASSSSVYGNSENKDEDSGIVNPMSPYAVSKLNGEYLCKAYSNMYGFPVYILRYNDIYGPEQYIDGRFTPVIYQFIHNAFSNGKITIHGDGNQRRSFTYVNDIVYANMKILSMKEKNLEKINCRPINISSDNIYSINEIAEILKNNIDVRFKIEHTKSYRIGDIKDMRMSTNNAKRLLEYEATMNIEEGITDCVNKYREFYIGVKKCEDELIRIDGQTYGDIKYESSYYYPIKI